jgi:hypothetical protein
VEGRDRTSFREALASTNGAGAENSRGRHHRRFGAGSQAYSQDPRPVASSSCPRAIGCGGGAAPLPNNWCASAMAGGGAEAVVSGSRG